MGIKTTTVTSHFINDRSLCAMLYGLPGSGKTLLTASAQLHPLLGDLAYVDADPDGLLTIANYSDKIQKVSYDSLKDLISLPAYLTSKYPTVHTVVFDTLTAVKSLRLAEIAEKRGDIDKSQIQDYGVMGNNIEKIVTDLRSAGYSVLFTAGVKDEEKDGRFIKRRPDLPPALNMRMEHVVSFMWHLYKASDGSYNLLYLDQTNERPIDIKTRNVGFINRMKALDKQGNAGIIKIGQVGDDPAKYPNLKTFYDLLLETLGDTND